jgi:hypothetical protein
MGDMNIQETDFFILTVSSSTKRGETMLVSKIDTCVSNSPSTASYDGVLKWLCKWSTLVTSSLNTTSFPVLEEVTFTVLNSPGLGIPQVIYDDFNTDYTSKNYLVWKIKEPKRDTLVEFYGFVMGISTQSQHSEITIKVTGVPHSTRK